MKSAIRCCISCILPCGALDVIRIVHSDGRVEEFSKSISAGEVMRANPKHVLRKALTEEGMFQQIVILPPDAELQRGKIYFLVRVSSPPGKSSSRKKRETAGNAENSITVTKLLISDQYLTEILSEKISTQRDRRRGRVGIWRPHLESISEGSNLSDL